MENAIEVKHLSKHYKDFTLEDISLHVPAGSVLGLVGENGAGKSTFIKSLVGLLSSDYETLNLLEKDMKSEETSIKEDIAVIFDTTHYNLQFHPMFIGKLLSKVYVNWNMETYVSYLKKFHLPPKKKLKEFSKGMKMKLEFAIAFSHDPKLLILDEATSGLDPIFRDEILDIIREFTEEENHTVLMSSHITSDLDKIADYIAFIHQGKLLFVKTYDDIRENYGIINCGKETLDMLHKDDIVAIQKEVYGYKVMVKNRLELQNKIRDLDMERASVEDVMLFYVKGEKV